jgi:hypothetical protein
LDDAIQTDIKVTKNWHTGPSRYTNYTNGLEAKKEEVCEECGHDHSFRPSFKDVKTSIDVIPLLMKKLLDEIST